MSAMFGRTAASTVFGRMFRAAKLDVSLYEEVEANAMLLPEALLVVAIVALASGIGALISGGILGLIAGIIWAIVGWAIWAWITYFVGTRLLPTPETKADWGQLARVTGYAQAPGILRIFSFIPVLGALVAFVVAIWQIVCMVIGVRQALDYTSTGRAVGVVVIGYVVVLVIDLIVVGMIFGSSASLL